MNASKVATWAGILAIPSVIVWYVAQFRVLLYWLPAGVGELVPQTAMLLFLLCMPAGLIAIGIGQRQIARQLPIKDAESRNGSTVSELVPYKDWIEGWLRNTCRSENHQGVAPLDLTKHEGCSFTNCYMNWGGVVCALEGCRFYSNNNVTVPASEFAKALSFFMKQAYVPRQATLK